MCLSNFLIGKFDSALFTFSPILFTPHSPEKYTYYKFNGSKKKKKENKNFSKQLNTEKNSRKWLSSRFAIFDGVQHRPKLQPQHGSSEK